MLAFIHIEKAAGTTINSYLRRSFGIHHVDVEPWDNRNDYFSYEDFQKLKKVSPEILSIAGHKVKPYSDLDKLDNRIHYYTFVRDPIMRCASHYQYHINRMGLEIPFIDWIENEEYQNFQVKKISGVNDINKTKEIIKSKLFFVGIVEDFADSIIRFFNLTGIDFSAYPQNRVRQNIAKDNNIKKQLLLDPKTREKLIYANNLDIELYNYVKEISDLKQNYFMGDMRNNISALNNPLKMNLYLNIFFRNTFYKPLLKLYRQIYMNK